MNPLEERLRTAIIDTGAEVPPDHHSPPLRLPRQARRPPGMLRRGGPRHWPVWLAPLATAVVVTAVIAGSVVASHLVFSVTRQPAAAPSQVYEHLPPYYAGFTPDGGFGIRETATGRLLRGFRSYDVATATPDGHTFVVGSWPPPRHPGSGAAGAGLGITVEPLRFEVVHVTPGGTTHASHISLPETLTQHQMPSIAISPDGRRLAVAYVPRRARRTEVVQVVTLATGKVRQWAWPNANWAPVLNPTGAWSADGRTLAVEQHLWSTRLLTRPPMVLLDTAGDRRPGKQVVLHVPAGFRIGTLPVLTPDGAEFIAPIETGKLPNPWQGAIAAFSARTGALIDVRGHWLASAHEVRAWNTLQILAWTNWSGSKLVVVQPRGSVQVLGELSDGVFTPTGALLPRQASGYRDMRRALIANSGVIG